MLVPRGDRDLGVAYQTHPGNQASSRGEAKTLSGGGGKPSFPSPSAGDLRELPSRGEAKDSALLSSRDAGHLEPPGLCSLLSMKAGNLQGLEKAMATHSSILAWEISWLEEPGAEDAGP